VRAARAPHERGDVVGRQPAQLEQLCRLGEPAQLGG
jgi:hypothetical protein